MSDALSIPYPDDKIFVDYVFVNQTLLTTMVKTKILDFEPTCVADVPEWDCSMFETFEEIDPRPEQKLRPVRLYRCPFRRGRNKIVLCDLLMNGKPPVINNRPACVDVLERVKSEEPWFGLEQEFFIVDRNGTPHEWPDKTEDTYNRWAKVNVGTSSGFERHLSESHAKACLFAGIKLCGVNREEACAQWEYQIGPCDGVRVADDLVVSRYLLDRVAEELRTFVSFKPKPVLLSKLASGLHLNFSTKRMRQDGGIRHIEESIKRLETIPQAQILKYYDRHYGADNAKRLIGDFFIPDLVDFTWGVANKFASVRIPPMVAENKTGYYEERRPCSDADPYMVITAFVKAVLLNESI